MQRACAQCGRRYEALTDKSLYCSGRCRAAASRERRDQEVREGLDQVARGLAKAREAMAAREQKGRRR